MITLQDYVQRLVDIGYQHNDAVRIVKLYDRQRDLEGLDHYIACKESLKEVV